MCPLQLVVGTPDDYGSGDHCVVQKLVKIRGWRGAVWWKYRAR